MSKLTTLRLFSLFQPIPSCRIARGEGRALRHQSLFGRQRCCALAGSRVADERESFLSLARSFPDGSDLLLPHYSVLTLSPSSPEATPSSLLLPLALRLRSGSTPCLPSRPHTYPLVTLRYTSLFCYTSCIMTLSNRFLTLISVSLFMLCLALFRSCLRESERVTQGTKRTTKDSEDV
jgi:hypothetical protein